MCASTCGPGETIADGCTGRLPPGHSETDNDGNICQTNYYDPIAQKCITRNY